ncbi:hypothetical protein GOBAR_DD15883 [Gossypium barbadense]|nr:hypothetical protein GOBAR_DD15883 [Gossypium barbadense]
MAMMVEQKNRQGLAGSIGRWRRCQRDRGSRWDGCRWVGGQGSVEGCHELHKRMKKVEIAIGKVGSAGVKELAGLVELAGFIELRGASL